MARKTILSVDPQLRKATEEYRSLSRVRFEQAREAYEYQEIETQRVIDRIVATLQGHATGTVSLKVGNAVRPIKVDDATLGFNLLWLAVQVVSDLAFCGYRVANFEFDPSRCADCGAKIKKAKGRRGRR